MPNKKPTFNYENFFWSLGCNHVAGVDEAGVAPLAGPVVAAAVVLKPGSNLRQFKGVADSKLLTHERREELYQIITTQCQSFGVGLASVEEIDQLNIHKATRLAMQRAAEALPQFDTLLIDGPFAIPQIKKTQFAIVDGDAKVASIAAASIIAKVTRDRLMAELDALYPVYKLAQHKGYPTKLHIAMIKEYGATPIHRQSFLTHFR